MGTTRPATRAPRRGLRRTGAATLAVSLIGAGALTAIGPAAAGPSAPVAADGRSTATTADLAETHLSGTDRARLATYLADTYTSLTAMTDPATGLPSDNIAGDLDPSSASAFTSPTNIGGYLWSTVLARDLGVIDADEAYTRMATTLATLGTIERHDASGMFYNWYDPATGDRVLIWPEDGNVVQQFLSSVDNGWLAASLRVVAEAEPRLAGAADALYDSMNFGVFYNADARPGVGAGLLRGGFWDEEPTGCSVAGDYLGSGTDVFYTCHHYDTTVSETRIATYLGIANGQVPPAAYYASYRTFPSTCDWSWQDQRPSGVTRTYLGIDVYEGVYHYGDMSIVPGWGGSMFEALMPDMLVPEAQWGPTSWGVNHPLVVRAQKEHGLDEAGYGYWGFSPASNPFGGYAEYGVDVLGLRSDGYLSDGVTDVDLGFAGCREATNPTPEFGDGVVTPHAAFLGLSYDPRGVLDNVTALAEDFDVYGPGGFYDSVAVRSGTVAERYLSLDQSMIVAAIGNYLLDDALKGYFVDDRFERAVRPLLAAETFSSSAAPVLPVVTSPADGTRTQVAPVALVGTGEPGGVLTAVGDGPDGPVQLCTAQVDADGGWSCDLAAPLTPGVWTLRTSTLNDAGITVDGAPTGVEVLAAPGPQPTTSAPATPAPSPDPTGTPAPVQPGPGTSGGTTTSGVLASTGARNVGLVAAGAVVLTLAGRGLSVLSRRRAA